MSQALELLQKIRSLCAQHSGNGEISKLIDESGLLEEPKPFPFTYLIVDVPEFYRVHPTRSRKISPIKWREHFYDVNSFCRFCFIDNRGCVENDPLWDRLPQSVQERVEENVMGIFEFEGSEAELAELLLSTGVEQYDSLRNIPGTKRVGEPWFYEK